MPVLQKSVLLVACWFLAWIFLGTGIKCYKKYQYEASAIGFTTAFMLALYLFKLILLV